MAISIKAKKSPYYLFNNASEVRLQYEFYFIKKENKIMES